MSKRRWSRRLLALTSMIALMSTLQTTATADENDTVSSAVRTFVTLRVNTTVTGETVAVLDSGDVFLEPSALSQLHVPLASATHRKLYDSDFVSLRSLAKYLSYKVDTQDLILDLTLSPEIFGTRTFNLGQSTPSDITYTRDRSAFLNYSVTQDTSAGANGFAELGATLGTGLIYTSLFDNPTSKFARGLTNLTFDNHETLRSTVFGDVLATSGDLGGSPYIAGVQVGRVFDLNPYFVQFPTLNFSGSMSAPGRADVYVNGVLVRSVPLQPGEFSLQGIAPPTGASNTQVVVTDSLGRSTILGGAAYGVPSLLRQGLTDYQYSAGMIRDNALQAGDRYDGYGYVGRYRVGLTNDLTVGGRIEGSNGLTSGGPTLDFGTRFGAFHAALAASRSNGTGGYAGDLGYNFSSSRLGFGGSAEMESDGYTTTSLTSLLDRPKFTAAVFGNYQLSHTTSLSLNVSRADYRDSGTQSSASSFISFDVGSVAIDVGVESTTGTSSAGLLTNGTSYFVTMLLGTHGRSNTSLTSTTTGTKTVTALQTQQALPTGIGFGYRAQLSSDPSSLFNGDARYNGRYGSYDLTTLMPLQGRPDTTATVAGGIADVDGKIGFSQPLTDSFAVVDIPRQPDVHVYLNGQDMGETDGSGRLVVTHLVPNYANQIRIAERETAFDTEITTPNQSVAPGVRSGTLIEYGVRKVAAFTGKVLVRSGGVDVVPSAGAFSLSSALGDFDSDLGDDGQFYFENLKPGDYQGKVEYAGGTCNFTVTVPPPSGVLSTMGTLVCVRERS